MDINSFIAEIKKFKELEKRAPFYKMSTDLLHAESGKHTSAALILLLSTWNFAAFRYIVNDFDIQRFEEMIDGAKNQIESIKLQPFEEQNLAEKKEAIEELFRYVTKESVTNEKPKGLGPTGASKILHLLKPDFFVMWDGYIRGEYQSYYVNKKYTEIAQKLKDMRKSLKDTNEIQKSRYNSMKPGESYYKFLEFTKDKFGTLIKDKDNLYDKIALDDQLKGDKFTFAKMIDEYNYVKITYAAIKLGKKAKENLDTEKI